MRYRDFETFSRRKTVGYLLDTMYDIYHVCLEILHGIGKLKKPVRLLGVSVTSLAEESMQLYLLDRHREEKELSKAIAEINSKFGDFTIKPASLLLAEEFGKAAQQS